MRRGGGGASALLQKVNYQLKGERPVKTPEELEEENLDAYFSSLSKKSKNTEIDWSKFGDGSDLDISEKAEEKPERAASKFLKKKPAPAKTEESKFIKKKTGPSAPKPGSQSLDNTGKSSALNKAAAYTSKYGTPKVSTMPRETLLLSDSDLDLSLSMDEEVLADVHKLKASKPVPTKQSISKKAPPGNDKGTTSPNKPAGYYAQQAAKLRLSSGPSPGPYQSALLTETDDDSSSMQIGKSGSKFLKKKPTPAPAPEPEPEIPEEKLKKADKAEKTPRPSMFQLKSSQKYSTQVKLDTDEESMADFIGGLSSSDGGITPRVLGEIGGQKMSPKGVHPQKISPKVTPRGILKTPRTAQSPSTMELISEEESDLSYQMDEEDENSSVSSAASFKLNVMEVTALDLEPIMEPTPAKKDNKKNKTKGVKLDITPRYNDEEKYSKSKKKKEKKDDVFSNLGLHTVDELFAGGSDRSDDESEASEIQTGGATSDIQTIMDDSGRQTPLRSILSPTPRTPRSSRSRVKLSLSEVTEIRSRSPSPEIISTARASRTSVGYDDDFEESIVTEQPSSVKTIQTDSETDTESDAYTSDARSRRRRYSHSRQKSEDFYSDDFTSGTETSRRTRRRSRGSSVGSYSEDFTDFTETSDRSRSPSPQPRRSVKTRSCEVQTGPDVGLVYHWNVQRGDVASLGLAYGLGSVDPTPIASHVVSPDAIEAMTAYSPSVLALNDMLRQQIQMTATFMENQKRLHRSMLNTAILPDFEYTTLDDTKKYIRRHRKKTLTFEEALAQVKCDMGME